MPGGAGPWRGGTAQAWVSCAQSDALETKPDALETAPLAGSAPPGGLACWLLADLDTSTGMGLAPGGGKKRMTPCPLHRFAEGQ